MSGTGFRESQPSFPNSRLCHCPFGAGAALTRPEGPTGIPRLSGRGGRYDRYFPNVSRTFRHIFPDNTWPAPGSMKQVKRPAAPARA